MVTGGSIEPLLHQHMGSYSLESSSSGFSEGSGGSIKHPLLHQHMGSNPPESSSSGYSEHFPSCCIRIEISPPNFEMVDDYNRGSPHQVLITSILALHLRGLMEKHTKPWIGPIHRPKMETPLLKSWDVFS